MLDSLRAAVRAGRAGEARRLVVDDAEHHRDPKIRAVALIHFGDPGSVGTVLRLTSDPVACVRAAALRRLSDNNSAGDLSWDPEILAAYAAHQKSRTLPYASRPWPAWPCTATS